MYDIYDLTLIFLLVLLCMYWWRISEQKSIALETARNHCDECDVQLLDQTLVFKRHQRLLDSRGQKRLCRIYEFDFTRDGEQRYQGEITMNRYHTLRIVLESDLVEITDF